MKPLVTTVLLLSLGAAVAGCSGSRSAPEPQTTPSASLSSPAPAPSPTRATAAPRPDDRACYQLDYDAAVAPINAASPTDCGGEHTSMTYSVDTLDAVVDGHLLAVDSQRVQQQVARSCPERLAGFLGGTPEDLHLSMLRAVWFTPTVEESDAGADWYRCDVIAIASEGQLASLTGRLAGVLGRPGDRAAYGMCATAEPGDADFQRVICSADHSWKAIRTVGFDNATYPGPGAARAAGQQPCEDAARARAADPLSFRWGYEWPTAKQWASGQTYGLCWIPD